MNDLGAVEASRQAKQKTQNIPLFAGMLVESVATKASKAAQGNPRKSQRVHAMSVETTKHVTFETPLSSSKQNQYQNIVADRSPIGRIREAAFIRQNNGHVTFDTPKMSFDRAKTADPITYHDRDRMITNLNASNIDNVNSWTDSVAKKFVNKDFSSDALTRIQSKSIDYYDHSYSNERVRNAMNDYRSGITYAARKNSYSSRSNGYSSMEALQKLTHHIRKPKQQYYDDTDDFYAKEALRGRRTKSPKESGHIEYKTYEPKKYDSVISSGRKTFAEDQQKPFIHKRQDIQKTSLTLKKNISSGKKASLNGLTVNGSDVKLSRNMSLVSSAEEAHKAISGEKAGLSLGAVTGANYSLIKGNVGNLTNRKSVLEAIATGQSETLGRQIASDKSNDISKSKNKEINSISGQPAKAQMTLDSKKAGRKMSILSEGKQKAGMSLFTEASAANSINAFSLPGETIKVVRTITGKRKGKISLNEMQDKADSRFTADKSSFSDFFDEGKGKDKTFVKGLTKEKAEIIGALNNQSRVKIPARTKMTGPVFGYGRLKADPFDRHDMRIIRKDGIIGLKNLEDAADVIETNGLEKGTEKAIGKTAEKAKDKAEEKMTEAAYASANKAAALLAMKNGDIPLDAITGSNLFYGAVSNQHSLFGRKIKSRKGNVGLINKTAGNRLKIGDAEDINIFSGIFDRGGNAALVFAGDNAKMGNTRFALSRQKANRYGTVAVSNDFTLEADGKNSYVQRRKISRKSKGLTIRKAAGMSFAAGAAFAGATMAGTRLAKSVERGDTVTPVKNLGKRVAFRGFSKIRRRLIKAMKTLFTAILKVVAAMIAPIFPMILVVVVIIAVISTFGVFMGTSTQTENKSWDDYSSLVVQIGKDTDDRLSNIDDIQTEGGSNVNYKAMFALIQGYDGGDPTYSESKKIIDWMKEKDGSDYKHLYKVDGSTVKFTSYEDMKKQLMESDIWKDRKKGVSEEDLDHEYSESSEQSNSSDSRNNSESSSDSAPFGSNPNGRNIQPTTPANNPSSQN